MLVLALAAQVLVVLDISVVNTAMPTIGADLQLASRDLQWMVTAYLLLSGGGLLLGGRIADLLPTRRVFMTGITLFTTASLFSGFASSAGELIAGRALQGAGAALMTPAALAIIMTTYTGAQRARGLALWGAIGGLGIAAGVAVGGALTTWAGWQAIFWVNVPVGVVALVAAARLLPRSSARPASASARFDIARRRHRRHRPGHLDVHPRRHRDPRLDLVADDHRSRRRRPWRWPGSSSSSVGPRRRWCTRTPGRSLAGVVHRRHARRHRAADGHHLPHHELRADHARATPRSPPGSRSCRWPSPWSSAPTSPATSPGTPPAG